MIGVYIHIPFCKNICTYCDFCKMFYNTKYVSKYLNSLEEEINNRYKNEEISSIYIGGGTPSCLNQTELDRLLKIITKFKLKENYEYTIECNVENIDEEKLKLFKNYGVNRISFGVQSFSSEIIKILGRGHDKELVFNNIKLTKKYFDNINIDLIYGVNNDLNIVKDDINNFLKLNISHISCYSLILEEHTKLWIDEYKYISSDLDYEMFKIINNKLTNNGYNHYEISNYAKEGYESIHNKNYWLNGSYYGFGLGAVSYLDNHRISNTENMNKYFNNNIIASDEYEDINRQKENDLILGLRLIDGINIDNFNKKYRDNLLDKEIIKKLISENILEINKKNLRCQYNKIYLLNSVLVEIIGSEL